MSSWSLETELTKLTKTRHISAALFHLGIIGDPDSKYTIREQAEWERGGAETYVYRFWVRNQQHREVGYIIKACAVFAPNSRLEKILLEWISRRKVLSENGISTPKLFAYGHGVVLEESIPYSLKENLARSSADSKNLLKDIAFYAGTLSKLGFCPINPFKDLRSRGDDIVVIDFGEDLGPPQVANSPNLDLLDIMLNQFEKWELLLSGDLKDELSGIYSTVMN